MNCGFRQRHTHVPFAPNVSLLPSMGIITSPHCYAQKWIPFRNVNCPTRFLPDCGAVSSQPRIGGSYVSFRVSGSDLSPPPAPFSIPLFFLASYVRKSAWIEEEQVLFRENTRYAALLKYRSRLTTRKFACA
jgi:hypothetical protein